MTDNASRAAVPEADRARLAPSGGRQQARGRGGARRAVSLLSFRNISAIYVFVGLFVLFSIWVPDTFLAWTTWRTLLAGQAVTGVLAVGLVLALSAGVFDLAIGAELGFGSILAAWLLISGGLGAAEAVVLVVVVGAFIGLVQGFLVVRLRIDSFIATLGMSSILLALSAGISKSQQILGLPSEFQFLGNHQIFGLTLPVYLMVVLALLAWYVLERTPMGRRVYATGGNIEAARLAGVRTTWVIFGALSACGALAAFSGVLVSSTLGVGDPTIGPAYLLPAFSAAFLGSTQFRGGRFNIWGTIVAVYVLATGVKGLQLAGAPVWIPDLFNGLALLLAVGLAKYQVAPHRASAVRRALRFPRA